MGLVWLLSTRDQRNSVFSLPHLIWSCSSLDLKGLRDQLHFSHRFNDVPKVPWFTFQCHFQLPKLALPPVFNIPAPRPISLTDSAILHSSYFLSPPIKCVILLPVCSALGELHSHSTKALYQSRQFPAQKLSFTKDVMKGVEPLDFQDALGTGTPCFLSSSMSYMPNLELGVYRVLKGEFRLKQTLDLLQTTAHSHLCLCCFFHCFAICLLNPTVSLSHQSFLVVKLPSFSIQNRGWQNVAHSLASCVYSYHSTATSTRFHIVYGCLQATAVELSSHNTPYSLQGWRYLLSSHLHDKFVDP